MTYYAIRWSIDKNGATVKNDRTGDKAAMERQYYLYCANAATNEAQNKLDAVEWGTFEGGKLDRKVWNNEVAE